MKYHLSCFQYEENILECCLSLLDKDKRAKEKPNKWAQKRGDPVWVSRAVSAMVFLDFVLHLHSPDTIDSDSGVKYRTLIQACSEVFWL